MSESCTSNLIVTLFSNGGWNELHHIDKGLGQEQDKYLLHKYGIKYIFKKEANR